ncbi:uncharacterized protein LOC109726843 [Ananas comosus]|uniref:Uncharacterized protein LOC109726843 n=1 Tax=Ananas comosus TaxID=4615 RepID=A0A6P5GU86_ANACO|nr:uncharacterized protein LOC109726843 [Ananas comosus]
MGCGSSRAESSELVALCRARMQGIRAAAGLRYDLAAAHAAHFRALAAAGAALHRLVLDETAPAPAPAPAIVLPASEGKEVKPRSKGSDRGGVSGEGSGSSPSSSTVTPLSHDLSGEGSGSGSGGGGGGGGGSSSNGDESVVIVEEKPSKSPSPRSYFMRSSSGIPYIVYDDPNAPQSSNYGYGFGFPPYASEPENFGYNDRTSMSSMPAPSTPPPPPPPEGLPWEFFDPFNSYDQLASNGAEYYTSSPNLSEIRAREGIPDLEEEVEEEEETKEVEKGRSLKTVVEEVEEEEEETEKLDDKKLDKKGKGKAVEIRSSGDEEGSGAEKQEVAAETGNGSKKLSAPRGTRDVREVVGDIEEQFKLAAESSEEVSGMLEVGKVPYRSRNRISRVLFSRILDPLALPLLTPPRLSCKPLRRRKMSSSRRKPGNGDSRKQVGMSSGNLSSTLEKLYVWEKKLYKEVKEEEKVRVIYEKKYRRLNALDGGGAENDRIASAQASVRKLRTKIGIIIKSINTISNRIHKIRDEELRPQLVELIQGLLRMWKQVLNCHQKQLEALNDSKSRQLMAKTTGPKKYVARTTKELEKEIVNWCYCLKNWIKTQKSFVEALNGWLVKWLPKQQEEETADGVPPFSPSRLGAPAAFIICNDWFQATARIREGKLIKSINNFARIIRDLWESQEEELRRRQKVEYLSKAYDRKLKSLRESGISEHMEVVSSGENSENGLEHDARIAALHAMKRRRDEERAKHKEAVNKLQDVASSLLENGLVPVIEELEKYFLETLKEYDAIRIKNNGAST